MVSDALKAVAEAFTLKFPQFEGAEFEEDVVNEPEHYKQGSFEVIDEMIIVFGVENTIQFCKMNAWKYRARAPFKGKAEQDMAKANCYLEMAAELEAIRNENFELLKEGKLR